MSLIGFTGKLGCSKVRATLIILFWRQHLGLFEFTKLLVPTATHNDSLLQPKMPEVRMINFKLFQETIRLQN
jgi:hypothetical protein